MGSPPVRHAIVLAVGLLALLDDAAGRRPPRLRRPAPARPGCTRAVIAGVALPFLLLAGRLRRARALRRRRLRHAARRCSAASRCSCTRRSPARTRGLLVGSFARRARSLFFLRGVGARAELRSAAWRFIEPNVFQTATFAGGVRRTPREHLRLRLLHKERADAEAARLATTRSAHRRVQPPHLPRDRGARAVARAPRRPAAVDHHPRHRPLQRRERQARPHASGDEVLQDASPTSCARRCARKTCWCASAARSSCVMLPDVPGPGAVVVAGRIRKAVAAEPIMHRRPRASRSP